MNSNVNYRKKIKQGLENGMINYDKTTVTFNDGHVIGGVLANTQEELINIVEKCLYRKDFSIPDCLQSVNERYCLDKNDYLEEWEDGKYKHHLSN